MKFKSIGPSLVLYILGMASYLISDILVVSLVNDEQLVSKWAFIKSMLVLTSVVAVFGAEQSILRFPQNLLENYKTIISRTILYSIIISICLSKLSPIDNFIFWVTSIIGLSAIVIIYSTLRTSRNYNLAMIANNLWKILILLVVFVLYFLDFNKLYYAFTISIILSILILIYFLNRNMQWIEYYKNHKDTKVSTKYFFSISNFFIISALTLNISVGFEQLALNSLGLHEESALYLAHTSALLPIILLLNGFISFYLGPYVKNNTSVINKKQLSKLILVLALCSLILTILSLVLGYIFFKYYYINYSFNFNIGISVALIGALRVMYIIPSSFVGVIGRDELTKKYILYNLSVIVLSCLILFYFRNSHYAFELIIILSIFNWVYRVSLGFIYSYKNLENI